MTNKQEKICELRKSGLSQKQVAEAIRCSKEYVKQVCKRNDIHLVQQKCDPVKLLEGRAPNFEYAGGFINCDGYIDVRCKICGHVKSRSLITIRHKNIACDNCKRIAEEEREKQKERERQIEADKKAWDKIRKVKSKQLSFSVCKGCGSLFFSERFGVKYCTKDCQKRTLSAIGKDKRFKKMKDIVVDRSITVEKLYEMSKGVCALCGGQCDWSDHVLRDDGTFVVGAMYPSIDHVKPISKGGLHEWSNVQLAHLSCNSKKSNKI